MCVSPSVSVLPSIARLLARSSDPARLIPALHQAALDVSGATASVLLRPDPTSGRWHAVSGAGLETLTVGPWLETARGAEAAGQALATGRPLVIASLETELPDLAILLGASACVLVPLVGAEHPVGLLLLVLPPGLTPDLDLAATIGDAMVIALDRARTADELALHRDVRDLIETFARGGTSPLALTSALEAMCRGVARLTAADVAEVWLHDRRARELVLAATSDARRETVRPSIPTADLNAQLAASLRRDRPELVTSAGNAALGTNVGLLVPLRGRRRALAVLAVYGVRLEPGGEVALLDRAAEIGRQLSAILENVQLLDDVLRSRAELEDVFNSLTDLVAVTDSAGRIVEANRAFAARVGQTRDALVDRRLNDLLSSGLAEWIQGERHAATPAVPARRELVDQRLGGTFNLTLTPLAGLDPAPGGLVLVARDVTVESRLEAERASLERRPPAIREAAGARPVRGRRRARVEQPAARGARPPRAVACVEDFAGVASARPRAGLPRSRPCRAHRPQPARVRWLGPFAPSASGHQRRCRARAAAEVEGARRPPTSRCGAISPTRCQR